MDEERDLSIIGDVIRRRIEGIKLKKPEMIREVINVELYSKFDDWPPGIRMLGEEALKNEMAALKVLEQYRYSLSDLLIKTSGGLAWASFNLQYDGVIRKRSFQVRSRVSMVLAKSASEWRIVHEHFSIMPESVPTLATTPIEEEVRHVEESKDNLREAILKVLSDGLERNAAEIAQEVFKVVGKEVATPTVVDKCRELVIKGVIESKGRFYPKYKIRRLSS